MLAGKPVWEISPKFKVINESQRFTSRCNAIVFANQGSDLVRLNKSWTLTPGQSIMFGSQNDFNIVLVEVDIFFENPATATELRLEICEIKLHASKTAHYIDEPIRK